MSWIQQLCKVYDDVIDCCDDEGNPLAPIGFSSVKETRYHITISENSECINVSVEGKKSEDKSIIPSTPEADARTKEITYPLDDNLKYFVADSLSKEVKDKKNNDSKEQDIENYTFKHLDNYLENLSDWCNFPDSPKPLKILYNYLKRKSVYEDIKKYLNTDKLKMGQRVSFSINDEDGRELYLREDIKESWKRYFNEKYLKKSDNSEICYVTGERLITLENHPKIIGNPKLISDKSGDYPFKSKGRFTTSTPAAIISLEASYKAHNSLKWLIDRQGFNKYGLIFVAWNTMGNQIKVPIEDDFDWDEEEKSYADTFQLPSKNISNAALGYEKISNNWDKDRLQNIIILGIEAATDGRISIKYYQELEKNDYCQRLNEWYEHCSWVLYSKKEEKWKSETPTPRQISKAVLGPVFYSEANEDSKSSAAKQMRQIRIKLLHCIIDKVPVSRDMVQSAFSRAIVPQSFTKERKGKKTWSGFEWISNVSVTCALISKYYYDRDGLILSSELDKLSNNRDYLFGRLLAVADILERSAIKKNDNENNYEYQTNAVRYMQRFVQKPVETWKQLYIKLIPYINKLEEKASYYQYLIGEIESKFIKEERLEQKALSYKFLCGFSSQRQKFFNRKNTDDSKELDINDEVVAFEESNLERSENAYNNTDKSLDSSKEEYLLPSDTSGLYGCLLAIADIVEFKALGDRYKGTTNALRLMESFSMKPVSTWKNIHDKLIPYFSKINMGFYKLCFRKIESSFDIEERQRNEALKDNFIYEYSRMRYALLHKKLSVSKQKAVEIEKITRDLAYGKLLSIENAIEILRINKNLDAKSKQSNSIKYMTAFSQKPNSVWNNVFRQRLKPFENKWIMKNNKYAQHLKKMEAIIKENCWDTDEPLGGSYLNGFYSNNNIKILEEIQNE